MSDELRLPDELAAIEARLAAHPLPPSPLNRDELLYQAGWSACEAKQEAARPVLVSSLREPQHRSRAIAAWSAVSAALAASLAVAATLAVAPDRAPTLAVATAEGARPPLAVDVDAPPASVAGQSPDKSPSATPRSDAVDRVLANFDAMLRLNRSIPSAAPWTTVGGPLQRRRWEDPIVVSAQPSHPAAAPPVTARGLLDELLPSPREGADSATPWLRAFALPGGESI